MPIAVRNITLVVLLLLAACGRPERPPRIAFVPIGEMQTAMLDDIARSLNQKLKVPIEMLSTLQLEESAIDRQRQQVIGEEMIALMVRGRAAEANDSKTVLIGITSADCS